MSYILEALRKLEENRRKTETSGLLNDHGEDAMRPARLRYLPYLLTAALLINSGVVLWWLHPWEKTKSAAAMLNKNPQTSFTPSFSRPLRVEEKVSRLGENHKQTAVKNIKEEAENSRTVPADPDARNVGATREDRKVYNLTDLPPSVRQDIPDLVISGHSYSADPSSRIAVINGRTMREGQVVTGGLRLQQITSDGVILSYQGCRFRKGVF